MGNSNMRFIINENLIKTFKTHLKPLQPQWVKSNENQTSVVSKIQELVLKQNKKFSHKTCHASVTLKLSYDWLVMVHWVWK